MRQYSFKRGYALAQRDHFLSWLGRCIQFPFQSAYSIPRLAQCQTQRLHGLGFRRWLALAVFLGWSRLLRLQLLLEGGNALARLDQVRTGRLVGFRFWTLLLP
jgi:hypothetical protein